MIKWQRWISSFWTWICKWICLQHESKRGYSPIVTFFLLSSVPVRIWLDETNKTYCQQKGRSRSPILSLHSPFALSLLSTWLCGEPAQLSKPGFGGVCWYSFLWNGQGSTRVVPEERKDIWPQQHEGSSTASTAPVNHKEGSAILAAPWRNRTQVLSWPQGRNCCLHSSSPWEGPLKDEEKWFQSLHRSQWLHCSKWPPALECWDCFSFTS